MGDVPMSVSFAEPARRMSLNDRHQWRARSRLTRAWRDAAHMAAVQAFGASPSMRRRPPSFVRVDFPVTRPNARRDPHNMAPTVKAIVDGLVDAQVWPDDNDRWVVVLDPVFHRAEQPFGLVTVTLSPRGDMLGGGDR